MNRLALALGLLAALTATACQSHTEEPPAAGKFVVTNPMRTDTELTRSYVAQIRAIQHIELRAMERGYLQEIYVDEGQRVLKGTKLFQIMPMIYQAELQKASATAQLAEIEYNNTKVLADKSVVSPNELAMAKARANEAQAEVSLAATHRSMTEVRAAFDGLVGRFHVRVGSLVDEGDLMTTLSDNSTMWVYFNVSEAEYLDYKAHAKGNVGTSVKLLMANGQIYDQVGRIQTIESDFDNVTGNIAFRAAFPNPNGLLRHGETGKVLMTTPLKSALLIPQKATFDVLDKKFVYVVDDKNVVHAVGITIQAEMPRIYVVATGLKETDKILVEGLRKVTDGETINVDYRQPSSVFGQLEVPAE